MIDPRDEELANLELDGALQPHEVALLRQALAARPELAALRRELRGLQSDLAALRDVEPPPGLAAAVLRRLPQRRGSLAPLVFLQSAFRRRPAFGLAFAFAGGLALGAVLLGRLDVRAPLRGPDEASVSGSLLPGMPLETLPLVDRQPIVLGSASAQATVRAGRGLLLAELQLASDEPADVKLAFSEGLTLVGFERSGPADPSVSFRPGSLSLRHPGGEGTYRVFLRGAQVGAAPLRLELRSASGIATRELGQRRGR